MLYTIRNAQNNILTNTVDISKKFDFYYSQLYTSDISKNMEEINEYLSKIPVPSLAPMLMNYGKWQLYWWRRAGYLPMAKPWAMRGIRLNFTNECEKNIGLDVNRYLKQLPLFFASSWVWWREVTIACKNNKDLEHYASEKAVSFVSKDAEVLFSLY